MIVIRYIRKALGYILDKNQYNRNNSVPVDVGALTIDTKTLVL